MNLYKKKWRAQDILKGLKLYYEKLMESSPYLINSSSISIDQRDVLLTINFLEDYCKANYDRTIVQSGPELDYYLSLDTSNFVIENSSKFIILDAILQLTHSGAFISFQHKLFQINSLLNKMDQKDQLEKIISLKHHYLKNQNSYSVYERNWLIEALELLQNEKDELIKSKSGTESIENFTLLKGYLNSIMQTIEDNDFEKSIISQDIKSFKRQLDSCIESTSYYDISKAESERDFHIIFLGILKGKLSSWKLKSNRESGFGRYDIILNPPDPSYPGVIFEFKVVKDFAVHDKELSKAIEQIKTNKYYYELKENGLKKAFFVAIVFCGKQSAIKVTLENIED